MICSEGHLCCREESEHSHREDIETCGLCELVREGRGVNLQTKVGAPPLPNHYTVECIRCHRRGQVPKEAVPAVLDRNKIMGLCPRCRD